MSNFFLSTAPRILIYLSDSIFLGVRILVPVLFMLKVFKFMPRRPDFEKLTLASNRLLLSGCVFFLITIFLTSVRGWFSTPEFIENDFVEMLTGSHWFQFAIPLFNFALLPNILWTRRLRQTIDASAGIVLTWFVSYFIVDYLTLKSGFISSSGMTKAQTQEMLLKVLTFLVILIIDYSRVAPGTKATK